MAFVPSFSPLELNDIIQREEHTVGLPGSEESRLRETTIQLAQALKYELTSPRPGPDRPVSFPHDWASL